MKKTLCILLSLVMLIAFCACDMSSASTHAGDKPKDLVATAVSATEQTISRSNPSFSFKVEVDQDTISGSVLYYDWFAYLMDPDSGEWGDFTFYRHDESTYFSDNTPIFDENIGAFIANDNPVCWSDIFDYWTDYTNGESRFKISCHVSNPVDGDDGGSRISSVQIDFFLTVKEGQ